MSLRSMLSQRADVVTLGSTGVDDLGRPVQGETSRVTYPCRLYLADTSEVLDSDSVVVDLWTIILPPEAVISSESRVESDGRVFEVLGTPDVKRTPRGVSHVTARLRFVGGAE